MRLSRLPLAHHALHRLSFAHGLPFPLLQAHSGWRRGHRGWDRSWRRIVGQELQSRGFISGIDATLSLLSTFLGAFDQNVQGLRVLQNFGEHLSLLINRHSVLDEIQQLRHIAEAELLGVDGLLEVFLIVERQVGLRNGCPVFIVHILDEGILQQEELVAQLQHRPVLRFKVGVERFTSADVVDVLDGEDINSASLLGAVLLPTRLPGLLLRLELREGFLPGRVLLFEVIGWLQVLDAGSELRL
mmetsp:Transcript_41561/g.90137  ORF Transcript_41561/g.90137 Transcript_41561/m.90137 type:complete len:244 (+) Transcript_41561:123-854(+)